MNIKYNIHEIQNVIVTLISSIPSYEEVPKNINDIVHIIDTDTGMSNEFKLGLVTCLITFLDIFSILKWDEDKCKLESEIPKYFSESMAWFFLNNQHMFSNWKRLGTAREIISSNLLEKAPHFLKSMEERRLELSERNHLQAGYSRTESVVILFIKGIIGKNIYFLHQWDRHAEGYQLIGGKQRPNET